MRFFLSVLVAAATPLSSLANSPTVLEVHFYDRTYVKIEKLLNQRTFTFCNQEAQCKEFAKYNIEKRESDLRNGQEKYWYVYSLATGSLGAIGGFGVMWTATSTAAGPYFFLGLAGGLVVAALADYLDGKDLTSHQVEQIKNYLFAPYVVNEAAGSLELTMSGPEFVANIEQAVSAICIVTQSMNFSGQKPSCY